MGISDRKLREKEALRERILDAAVALFLKEGFEKTSIRQIADAIEYSPATIYLYFKDKDELFFAIHHRGFDLLFARMSEATAILHPVDRLLAIGHTYLKFALENPEFYDLMFIMRAPMTAIKERALCGEIHCDWPHGGKSFNLLLQTMQDCIDQGLIRVADAEIAALAAWSVVHGLASLYIRERLDMLDIDEPATKMQAVLENFIRIIKT